MAEESDLEKECKRLLTGSSIRFDKLANISDNGWPDRTLIGLYSEIAFYEFKARSGKLRVKQGFTVNHLHARGFKVRVIDNVEDFINAIKKDFKKTIEANYHSGQWEMESNTRTEKNAGNSKR